MASLEIHVHPMWDAKFAKLADLVGGVVRAVPNAENGNGDEPDVHGLMFTDPDGETHIYAMDAGARSALLQRLTGGIVLPD